MGQRGFTLGEILIAILIVGVSVLTALGTALYAHKGLGKADYRFRASQKAVAVMADIEAQLTDDLDANVAQTRQPLPPQYNPEGVPAFEYEITEGFVGPPEDRLKEVNLTLYWTEAQGPQRFLCGSRFTE